MKSFFKHVIATILGAAIFTFAFLFLLYSVASYKINQTFRKKIERVDKTNAILRIELDGEVVDHVIEQPAGEGIICLSELNAVLEEAAEDPDILGIYIIMGSISGGYDSLEALRQIFEKFKKTSGKPIALYATYYSEVGLAFATVADHIILHLIGEVLISGISTKNLYYKSLLDRFSIEPIIYRAGEHKVESHPYTSSHMTEGDKGRWLNVMILRHKILIKQIADNRSIGIEELEKMVTKDPLIGAEEALDKNLIDAIGFEDKANEFFNKALNKELFFQGGADTVAVLKGEATTDEGSETKGDTVEEATDEEDEEPNYISYKAYKEILRNSYSSFTKYCSFYNKPKIAILSLEGEIITEISETDTPQISEKEVLPILEQYAEDDTIKAVIIIIDSPGGYVIPISTIAHAIERLKKRKPVICLVRNMACSGGLEIMVSCTKAIASSEATLIGSIGTLGSFWNFEKAAREHLSINADGVKTHPHADLYRNQFHAHSEEEKRMIQKLADKSYEQFKGHVKKHRNLTDEELEPVAGGIIYSAKYALKHKIIDGIGNLDEAIKLSLSLAGIDPEEEEYEIVYPIKRKDFIQRLNLEGQFTQMLKNILESNSRLKAFKPNKQKMYHAGNYPSQKTTTT